MSSLARVDLVALIAGMIYAADGSEGNILARDAVEMAEIIVSLVIRRDQEGVAK